MVTEIPMGMHTQVGVTSREEEGGTGGAASKVVVGTRAEDDRAMKRREPMACPSVLPSECLP